jgi:RND family efflux transporter MFP subunit
MVATTCPTAEELRDYVLGRLTEKDWEAIAEHVETCPQCQAAIATVDDVADTLITQLREPAPADSFLNESQCEAALNRARNITEGGTGVSPVMPEKDMGKMPVPLEIKEFGEYQILEELGQGGMGAVYKALHTKLDRTVAIKILTRARAGDQRAIARFEREMKAVGRFDHPHIVRAYDAREIDGAPVLVMEYVEGMDLGRMVQRLGPLPVAEACELVRQAAEGLQYIHEHGLVHRDLKPSNLILTSQGIVKILDLGLARLHFDQSEEEMTNSDQAMGTADYMAPEQASDSHAVDIRADIYSLGCTLYKLLAGCAPFEGSQYKGTFEKMTAHVQQPAPPIENLLPQIPRELAAILQRMLAKNPAERFSQPAEVVEALTPFCTDANLPALLTRAVELESEGPLSLRERARVRATGTGSERSEVPVPFFSMRRPYIPIAVGLMMLGLGFSLGILVTIKKDGKTTTVEAPEGSNIKVNEQGNVTVDLEKSRNKVAVRPIEQQVSGAQKPIHQKQRYTVDMIPVPDSYKLGPGDVFYMDPLPRYTPYGNEISRSGRTFIIDPSGKVNISSKIGEIDLQGLSLDEAESAIGKRIQEVFSNLSNLEFSFTIDIADKEYRDQIKKEEELKSHLLAPGDTLYFNSKRMPLGLSLDSASTIQSNGNIAIRIRGALGGYPIEEPIQLNLKGLTIEEAKIKVQEKLKDLVESNRERIVPKRSITVGITLQKLKQQRYTIDMTPVPDSYRLSPGDSLFIFVVSGPPIQLVKEINKNPHEPLIVDAAGMVNINPRLGKINVKELTLDEAERAVEKKIEEVLYNSKPVFSFSIDFYDDNGFPKEIAQLESYRINPGDVLGFNCKEMPEGISLPGQSKVQPNGNVFIPVFCVSYPFSSPIQLNVKGLTVEEAQKSVKEKLMEFFEKHRDRILPRYEFKVGITLLKLKESRQNPPEVQRALEEELLHKSAPEAKTAAITFRTVKVTRGDITATVSATGAIEPEEVVDVTAQVSGRIVSLGEDPRGATDPQFKDKKIDFNSPVEKDTVLAHIDDTLYKLRVQQEEAAYSRAKAELVQAQDKYKRAQEQVKSGLADDEAVATAKAYYVAAQTVLEQSEAKLKEAQINLDRTVIKSPIKGVIIARRVNVGQNIGPDPNAPSLFLIAKDLKKMQVWASVDEGDIGRIREGMTAKFTVDAFPNDVYEGKVLQIRRNASMVQNAVIYTVILSLDNSDQKLLPYMTANVKFEVDTRRGVLQVPNAALRWKPEPEWVAADARESTSSDGEESDRHRIWVLDPDGRHVRPIDVQIGLTDGTMTEISGPDVKEGMEVVVGLGPPREAGRGESINPIGPFGQPILSQPATQPTAAPAVSPVAELKALYGRWKVMNIEKDKDAELPLQLFGIRGIAEAFDQLNFAQDSVQIIFFDKGELITLKYRIETNINPKIIFFCPLEGLRARFDQFTSYCIYEIDGDKLKLCFVSPLKNEQLTNNSLVDSASGKVVVTLRWHQPSADEKDIKGEWTIVSQNEDGKVKTVEFHDEARYYLSFSDYTCKANLVTYFDSGYRWDSLYYLETEKVPKKIIFSPTTSGDRKGDGPHFSDKKGLEGIYKFDRDRLWIAYRRGGPAPEKFESTPDSGITLLELKRKD